MQTPPHGDPSETPVYREQKKAKRKGKSWTAMSLGGKGRAEGFPPPCNSMRVSTAVGMPKKTPAMGEEEDEWGHSKRE